MIYIIKHNKNIIYGKIVFCFLIVLVTRSKHIVYFRIMILCIVYFYVYFYYIYNYEHSTPHSLITAMHLDFFIVIPIILNGDTH